MRDRRTKAQSDATQLDDSDKENVAQQRQSVAHADKAAAVDGKRSRAGHTDDERGEQQHGSNNKKSKASHSGANGSRNSIPPLSPTPSPSFSSSDELLAEKDAAYAQLLAKYRELGRQKVDHTAALVAQYEAQTAQLRSSSQQLTQHWQDKCEQLDAAQRKETALRRKEAEAAMAVKELALAEKDKQLKEKQTANDELQRSVQAANEQISSYLLLTGTSITVPPQSSHRLVCCMVNASNRQRRLDFVLDTSQSEASGLVEYRPKRIELGGLAYPKCLKGSMNFAVDRTPNFTRYLLDALYKRQDEQDERAEEDEQQTEEAGVEQAQTQQDEQRTAEQKDAVVTELVQTVSDAVMA